MSPDNKAKSESLSDADILAIRKQHPAAIVLDGEALNFASDILAAADRQQGGADAPVLGHYIYIPAQQHGYLVEDLDEAIDDLTNCACEVTPLVAALTTQPQAISDPTVAPPRECSITEGPRDRDRQTAQPQAEPACGCHTCAPITLDNMRMILCAKCGNKRCPHANDHRNACTNSNDPGQQGSAYTTPTEPT